jgi:3-phosphoglycerate kinase/triosephosphate isomerase
MNLVQDLKLNSKTRVLLRCDLNLPQDESGRFTDLFRLESSLPTIQYLIERGATVFITSHLGSPKGDKDANLSLESLVELLSLATQKDLEFISDPFDRTLSLANKNGIFLIENLRFWKGEESADPELSEQFARDLINATGANIFVQDAFGVSHRSHTSLVYFPKLLPNCAGLLLQKEIQYLELTNTEHLSLIIGGAKVESKLPVISNFLDKASNILTGGVVANTFLKASGQEIASSLFSEENIKAASTISSRVKGSQTKLILPKDYVTAKSPEALLAEECTSDDIKSGQMILDIGASTISEYSSALNSAETIVWAGTLGFAENIVFEKGSKDILNHILDLKRVNKNLKIIIGGGDTVDFARSALSEEDLSLITHLSTGGGASLLMLAGQELPGIKALEESRPFVQNQKSSNLKNDEKTDQHSISGLKLQDKNIRLSSKAPVLIANLKSHFNILQAKDWLEEVLSYEELNSTQINFTIAAPALFLEEFTEQISKAKLNNPPEIISQDVSIYEEGASTGEISATMLSGLAKGTLVGHSERRFKMGNANETDQTILQKIFRAVDVKLRVCLCVGSQSEDPSTHKKEVHEQLISALKPLNSLDSKSIEVAYEPVFAIGTGLVPTPEYLKEQLASVKDALSDLGIESKVFYGGSVNESNANEILSLGFDGVLVGTASLEPRSLQKIATNMLSLI